MTSIEVEIYSRPGCHLCDEAKEIVEQLQRRLVFGLKIINVETDPNLEKRYGQQIPVVLINGIEAFKYRVDAAEFEKKVKKLWNP